MKKNLPSHKEPGIQKKPGQPKKQLQEDKSIILYVLNKIKTGCARDRLVEIILRNIQFNYFDLQVYIDELTADGFISVSANAKKRKILLLSPMGKTAINEIFHIIPTYIRELIDLYIEKNQSQINNQIAVHADYEMIESGDFEADLSLEENRLQLIRLKINLPTEKDALEICKKWKTDYQQVYANIIQSFY